jgi:hypothetical protein
MKQERGALTLSTASQGCRSTCEPAVPTGTEGRSCGTRDALGRLRPSGSQAGLAVVEATHAAATADVLHGLAMDEGDHRVCHQTGDRKSSIAG